MSTGELLSVEPLEMKFPFELKKQVSCSVQVTNKTENHVAFKVKTTNPKKYCVRPNTGMVLPQSTCDIVVTMQAQKEAPAEMQCKDKFLLQSVVAPPGATAKDVTAEMFNKEQGNVEECKLKVVYIVPRQLPSSVAEGLEEGFSPRKNVENNNDFLRGFADSYEKLPESKSLVSKLTEEKAAAIQQGNKLRQELSSLGLLYVGTVEARKQQKWRSIHRICYHYGLGWSSFWVPLENGINLYPREASHFLYFYTVHSTSLYYKRETLEGMLMPELALC